MDLMFSEDLIGRIRSLAERQGITPEKLVEKLVEQYEDEPSQSEPGSAAELAASAKAANIGKGEPKTDTAARSREILHNEYADYLKSRMDDQNADTISD